jgi:hypothetical protein
MKAYAVQMHDRRLLWIGGFLILPQFSNIWAGWVDTYSFNTVKAACEADFPEYFPWIRGAIDIVVNIFFFQRYFSELSLASTGSLAVDAGRN